MKAIDKLVLFKDRHQEFFTISLLPVKIIAIGMILGPWFAVNQGYFEDITILGLGVDSDLWLKFSFYAFLMIFFIFCIDSNIKIRLWIVSKTKLKRYETALSGVAIICVLIVFITSGIDIILGTRDTGEIRSTLGFMGPVYTYIVRFILPTLVFCNFLITKLAPGRSRIKMYLIYFMILVSVVMTGYKFTTIMVFLPLMACLWPSISIFHKLLATISAWVSIIGIDLYTGGSGGDILASFYYSMARATSVAAYGLLGSWSLTKEVNIELFPVMLNSLLGSHISQFVIKLFDIGNTMPFTDLSQLVTYEYYPDQARAAAGTTNLTLTLFGEMSLIFSDTLFLWLGLFIFILFVKLILTVLKRNFVAGNLRSGVLLFIFTIFTILPIVNSGGIFTFISLPNLTYVLLTYLMLFLVLPGRIKNTVETLGQRQRDGVNSCG